MKNSCIQDTHPHARRPISKLTDTSVTAGNMETWSRADLTEEVVVDGCVV